MAAQTPSIPSEQFYALNHADSAMVKRVEGRDQQRVAWDPWPVRHIANSDIFHVAQDVVRVHNAICITRCKKFTLLPASGHNSNRQGGPPNRPLYSLRSPSVLPVKIHIWQTHGTKIMASKGLEIATLTAILASLQGSSEKPQVCDICKHYQCWKSRSITKEWLQYVPSQLHDLAHQRWWDFNGFPFLSLPFELRDMVIRMNLTPVAEPWSSANTHFRRRTSSPSRPRPGYSRRSSLNLASVCKQLHSEVMTTLYLHQTFYFSHSTRFRRFFNQLRASPALGNLPTSRENVRQIEFDLNAPCLCELFDIPIDARVGDSNLRLNTTSTVLTSFFRSCLEKLRLQRVRIIFPYASYGLTEVGSNSDPAVCQKIFRLRVWAGIRVLLRDVPAIELRGYVDEKQKKEWMQELALERKGIAPDLKELVEWQKNIWEQHSATVCRCEPKCVDWATEQDYYWV